MTPDEETLAEFQRLGETASAHFADDSGKEWRLAYSAQRAAMDLYWQNPRLQAPMEEVARRFLWSLKHEIEIAARRAEKARDPAP